MAIVAEQRETLEGGGRRVLAGAPWTALRSGWGRGVRMAAGLLVDDCGWAVLELPVGMPGGMLIKERLESLDAAARTLTYSIVEGPMPVSNYLATVVVSESGSGCSVDWGASFDAPEGVPADGIGNGIKGAYAGMLKALKAKLSEG